MSFSKNVWFLIIFQLDNVQLFKHDTYQIPLFNEFFYGTHYTVAVLYVCIFVLNSSVLVTEKEITGWKILLVFEKCTLLGCYAMSRGNFLLTFQDNLSVPSSRWDR